MKERLLLILSTIFECDIKELDSIETVENWDSLSHLMMILAIEDEFDIKFKMNDIKDLTSFERIYNYINELLNK